MGLWWDKIRKYWRYDFEYQSKTYRGWGYRTRSEAGAERAEHKKRVKAEAKNPPKQTSGGFVQLLEKYLDWSERRHAPGNVQNKKVIYKKLAAFLKEDIPVEQLSPAKLHSFFETAPSNNSYNVYRKEVSAVFAWAQKHMGLQLPNPCLSLEKMPVPKKERRIPTRQEFLAMMAACPADDKPLLAILAHTLARIDEILRLTWQDVHFEQGTLSLWSRKNRAGEWKERLIPMNGDLQSMLMSLWKRRKQEKWVFYNERSGSRYLRRPKLMKSICKAAGVETYGFHPVRHFVATYLHDVKKIPTGVLSGILGHENKRTTEIYLHSVDEAQRSALKELEGIFDENLVGGFVGGKPLDTT